MLIILFCPSFEQGQVLRKVLVILVIIELFCNLSLPFLQVDLFIEQNRSIKLYVDWLSYSFSLNASLNAVKGEPFSVVWSSIKLINEFCILNYPHMLIIFFEYIKCLGLRLKCNCFFKRLRGFRCLRQIISQSTFFWLRLICQLNLI